MCGTKDATTSSVNTPPQNILDNYQSAWNQAQTAASAPFTPYGGRQTAQLTPAQYAAFGTIDQSQGIQAPFIANAAGSAQNLQNWNGNLQNTVPSYAQQFQSPYAGQIQNASQGYTAGQVANNAATLYNPAWGNIGQASRGPSVGNINDNTQAFMNPYTQDVVRATQANINEGNAQQQQQVIGNAAASGAWGGDRSAVAQAELARQQDLASNQTIANLNSQGFTQAQQNAMGLGQFNASLGLQGASTQGQLYGQQQQLGAGIAQGSSNIGLLGASELGQLGSQAQGYGLNLAGMQSNNWLQSAQLQGQLGQQAEQGALTGASAQLQSGAIQQAQNQAYLNNQIQQYYLGQQYPFQTGSYLANIASGIGSQSGGTNTTTAPQGNLFSSLGGLGLAGIGLSGLMSDERVKDNATSIGKTFDGQPIYRFNYKGDPTGRIGLMAQQVEKSNPGAVHEIQGIKNVDYWDATDKAAQKGHFAFGGGLMPRPHFDEGGGTDGGGDTGGDQSAHDMGLGSMAGSMGSPMGQPNLGTMASVPYHNSYEQEGYGAIRPGSAGIPNGFSAPSGPIGLIGGASTPFTGFANPGLLHAPSGTFAPSNPFGDTMTPGSGYPAPTVTGPLSSMPYSGAVAARGGRIQGRTHFDIGGGAGGDDGEGGSNTGGNSSASDAGLGSMAGSMGSMGMGSTPSLAGPISNAVMGTTSAPANVGALFGSSPGSFDGANLTLASAPMSLTPTEASVPWAGGLPGVSMPGVTVAKNTMRASPGANGQDGAGGAVAPSLISGASPISAAPSLSWDSVPTANVSPMAWPSGINANVASMLSPGLMSKNPFQMSPVSANSDASGYASQAMGYAPSPASSPASPSGPLMDASGNPTQAGWDKLAGFDTENVGAPGQTQATGGISASPYGLDTATVPGVNVPAPSAAAAPSKGILSGLASGLSGIPAGLSQLFGPPAAAAPSGPAPMDLQGSAFLNAPTGAFGKGLSYLAAHGGVYAPPGGGTMAHTPGTPTAGDIQAMNAANAAADTAAAPTDAAAAPVAAAPAFRNVHQTQFPLGAPTTSASDAVAMYKHALGLASTGGRIMRASGGPVIPYNPTQTMPYGTFGMNGGAGPMSAFAGVQGIPVGNAKFPASVQPQIPDPLQMAQQAGQLKNMLTSYSKGTALARGGRAGYDDGGNVDAIQAPGTGGGAGGIAPSAAAPAFGAQPSYAPTDYDRNMALMSAGFGMMASKSPFALQGIGEGAMQGVNYLNQARTQQRESANTKSEIDYRKSSVQNQAEQLKNQALTIANENKYRSGMLSNENVRTAAQAKLADAEARKASIFQTPLGMSRMDENGNLVPMTPGVSGLPSASPSSSAPSSTAQPQPTSSFQVPVPENLQPSPLIWTESGQKALGQMNEAAIKPAYDAALAAQDSKQLLGQLYEAYKAVPAQGWLVPGAASAERLKFANAANTLAGIVGFKMPFDPSQVGKEQDIGKLVTQLGVSVNKGLGREPGYILDKLTAAQPGLEANDPGRRVIMGGLMAKAQSALDYQDFLQRYMSRPGGSADGAQQAFNRAQPESNYVKDAQIIARMPQANIEALRANPQLAPVFDKQFGSPGLSRYFLQ